MRGATSFVALVILQGCAQAPVEERALENATHERSLAYMDCAAGASVTMADSTAAVYEIASAVLAACDAEFHQLRMANRAHFVSVVSPSGRGMATRKADELSDILRERLRGRVIKYLVEHRVPPR